MHRIHRFGQRNKNYPRPIVANSTNITIKKAFLKKSKLIKTKIELVKILLHLPDQVHDKKIITTKKRETSYYSPIVEICSKKKSRFQKQGKSWIPKRRCVYLFTNVSTYEETREAVRQILRKPDIITATHYGYAYSFADKHGKQHQGYDELGVNF
ncbi:hypothetical protein KUTeg_005715 [Tegillarca granosa]|uniref:Uncharacterized protein n=1 Tax=Tegillarca granosa TaxID=220873 RepID=A0ABQ9FHL8_TEGGR|nr:hypothetical protein KUTeg_005715 [Tegillarca granosa]